MSSGMEKLLQGWFLLEKSLVQASQGYVRVLFSYEVRGNIEVIMNSIMSLLRIISNFFEGDYEKFFVMGW